MKKGVCNWSWLLMRVKKYRVVWKLRKTGFCEGSCVSKAVQLQECPLGELLL